MTELQKKEKDFQFLGATSDYQSTCAGGRLRRDGEVCAHLSGAWRHVAAPKALPMEGPVARARGPAYEGPRRRVKSSQRPLPLLASAQGMEDGDAVAVPGNP